MLVEHEDVLIAVHRVLIQRVRTVAILMTLRLHLTLVPDEIVNELEPYLLKDRSEVGTQRDATLAPRRLRVQVIVVKDVPHVEHERAMVIKNAVTLTDDHPHVVQILVQVAPLRVVTRVVVRRRCHH